MTTTQVKPVQAAAPSTFSAAAVASGGSFAGGAVYWKITGMGSYGESAASAEATQTLVANGCADLTFSGFAAGTNGVRVYRGTSAGAENKLIAELDHVPAGWRDTGTAGTTASPPAAAAWATVTKLSSGSPGPVKSSIPSGLTSGAFQAMCEALTMWITSGGAGSMANLAKKIAAGAGYLLQEI